MRRATAFAFAVTIGVSTWSISLATARAEVKAWTGEITIPTYSWQEDINPKFWALEGGAKMSTTVHGAITYPYVMQDHLLRRKADRVYKALFLENEFLKVTCLPELGGRLHSVLDKSCNAEMFHRNGVIKPGMIAMRGAWISGGVEWNTGPHGHTVTVLSPVSVVLGHGKDGSAFLEISNQEKIFRSRWTVRVTLHPGRAYLDEQIRLSNPTDGMHPYYFWNCTAFPNKPGTRFIYPMTLGTDHSAREFFSWPIHEGRDLTWLKNYETYSSIFSVDCRHDFFGAYDVDDDRGIVQVANCLELSGKKAWTWGEWEFGKVAQQNLTDGDGPYIEVQSGPLPTQSDYGMLGPQEQVAWREWWYPVHGLGDGFEFATRDLAAQTRRGDGQLELRLLATGRFPDARCVVKSGDRTLAAETLDLAPDRVRSVVVAQPAAEPVAVTVTTREGRVLAAFTTPLPIHEVEPPAGTPLLDRADDGLSVEELCLKGRKFDRATDRRKAREYYEKALARDASHVASLRSLAVLDYEGGRYDRAIERLSRAVERDGDDGLSCFYLGAAHFRLRAWEEARRWAYLAARCSGTSSVGYDLVGRCEMNLGNRPAAIAAFRSAVRADQRNSVATDHLMLACHAAGQASVAREMAERRTAEDPTALVPRAVLALKDDNTLAQFSTEARSFLGEADFELLETSLTFAELNLVQEALRIVESACVHAIAPEQRGFLPLYYLAWFASLCQQDADAANWLTTAAKTARDGEFASRPEELPMLQYAIDRNPGDAQAHLQLGCLLANLGRVDEAIAAWKRAAELDGKLSIAWRNLGIAAAVQGDLDKAEAHYRGALGARPGDQTLYRDLAEILVAAGRRPAAIEVLENVPVDAEFRRAEITVMLAESYVAEKRFGDCIALLESVPYFVNWEGQDVTWRLFNQSHIERGCQRLRDGDAAGALADFEAALTYPANLNVGRSNRPEEAPAQYWRGQALAALGRLDEARSAWQAGENGADLPGRQNEYRQKCREALAEHRE
ncbi:MAG: DUF5107 domain-containing protein [Planctomycetes bacterium]|nr:DUF5107 domain-containing protein [Planctomycetota bacterium]